MWTTLRCAPSCPHIHSPYYDAHYTLFLQKAYSISYRSSHLVKIKDKYLI
jgi:hypothetical protein